MHEWQSILVNPGAKLEDAIAVLDREGLRIVLVVDGERRLLGTLTDGDVRRALLRHVPMAAPVEDAMFSSPQVALRSWSKERILALMEKQGLLQVPILDDERRVVGLETLHGLLQKRHKDNPVFIMAGGLGSRLQPLTNGCPKPLLKIGDKPILDLIVENFVTAGFQRFFISTHYMPHMIRDHVGDGSRWGVHVRYVHEEQPLGTAGALGLLPHDAIDLPLLMMNGDLLTNLNFHNLLAFHETHASAATMCVREYEHRVPYGVVESDGHRISGMIEKPVHRYFINAGIYLLQPQVVRSVQPGRHLDMPELLQEQIAQGRSVTMFPIHEYWLDIGRLEDFQRAQAEIAKL
jgi:dTDP-glucose pyrophosphorylase/predicted transcriptional regulator